MGNKYLMLDLNDPRSSKVAEVIANKTCKKILGLLAERELSETDISRELTLPINTVGYNIKNLLEAGLIEKTSNFFWSTRGKKINLYRVSNKKIVISPRSSNSFFISAVLGGLVLGLGKIGLNYLRFNSTAKLMSGASDNSGSSLLSSTRIEEALPATANKFIELNYFHNVWIWILVGLLLGTASYFLFRKLKGGSN